MFPILNKYIVNEMKNSIYCKDIETNTKPKKKSKKNKKLKQSENSTQSTGKQEQKNETLREKKSNNQDKFYKENYDDLNSF